MAWFKKWQTILHQQVIPPWQSQGLGGYEQPQGLPIVKV